MKKSTVYELTESIVCICVCLSCKQSLPLINPELQRLSSHMTAEGAHTDAHRDTCPYVNVCMCVCIIHPSDLKKLEPEKYEE